MWGTIPLPPDFCPTSQRNRAPHRTESCPTSNGITAPLAPEYALKGLGVDFVKVHDHTPREVFFAIAAEAPKVGLAFAGHVPMNVTVDETAVSGMKSIEHLANFRVTVQPAIPTVRNNVHRCSTNWPQMVFGKPLQSNSFKRFRTSSQALRCLIPNTPVIPY
jgi:hypothetical protein